MADIVAANVTVTITKQEVMDGSAMERTNDVVIAYGNGALTYPVGGIPLPAIAKFGLSRNLKALILIDAGVAAGFVPNYDITNHKLKLFAETTVGTNQPLIEATNALAPAATSIKARVTGW